SSSIPISWTAREIHRGFSATVGSAGRIMSAARDLGSVADGKLHIDCLRGFARARCDLTDGIGPVAFRIGFLAEGGDSSPVAPFLKSTRLPHRSRLPNEPREEFSATLMSGLVYRLRCRLGEKKTRLLRWLGLKKGDWR